MARLAKIGLAIVIVVSVASILITPDPTDDVNGLLQQRHVVKAPVARILPASSETVRPATAKFSPRKLRAQAQTPLLDLTCVLLC